MCGTVSACSTFACSHGLRGRRLASVQHIWTLEGEREARGQEATEASQRHALALEQVKLRDMAAADLQKKVHSHWLRPCLLAWSQLLYIIIVISLLSLNIIIDNYY